MSKRLLITSGDYTCIQNEKAALQATNHPFLTKLYGTYQDAQYLYMVLQFAFNGELSDYLPLAEPEVVWYMSELVLALEYLHTVAFIIHR
jgi:protein kinase A